MEACRVLDLHGRRSDEAIRELTSFLETIRVAATRVLAAPSSEFYVTVITGSGSHSSHGPILRSVVQRLLEKRGMSYQLERGGGAFRVNALSGHDLYQPDAPVDSKVVVADNDSFHQMAAAASRRRHHQHGSFADTIGMTQQSTVASHSSHRPLHRPSHRLPVPAAAAMATPLYDPLPRQVAEEDTHLRTAVEKSRSVRDYEARLQRQHEEELERAREESLSAASRTSSQEMIEGQESLLKLVSQRSIADEQQRKEQAQKEFEDELLKAIEESLRLDNLKSEEDEETIASEEFLLQKALAESEKVKSPEDELLQKILKQSEMEQKRIEEEEQKLLEQAINDSSCVADNSNSIDSSAEEEELKRAIEMSKELF
uniref:Smr domain-containing protein n=1 Tax=Skeletonema marinoi TaxID=267567 RepID=A0A7S2M8P5_9STRA|mmetsp:Transcript_6826/g.11485  ORF Transcript_6826/g.11485 Transcript_6826/m.11485 type:complete len:372 (+) Transcript_6826:196-1311(+)